MRATGYDSWAVRFSRRWACTTAPGCYGRSTQVPGLGFRRDLRDVEIRCTTRPPHNIRGARSGTDTTPPAVPAQAGRPRSAASRGEATRLHEVLQREYLHQLPQVEAACTGNRPLPGPAEPPATFTVPSQEGTFAFPPQNPIIPGQNLGAMPSYEAYTQIVGTSSDYRAGVEEYDDGQCANWTCSRWS